MLNVNLEHRNSLYPSVRLFSQSVTHDFSTVFSVLFEATRSISYFAPPFDITFHLAWLEERLPFPTPSTV